MLLQIHSVVHRRHLVLVAIEHQSLDALTKECAIETAFRGLAPARMVHIWIYVGIEAVLVGRGLVPRGRRLAADEVDLDDRFDALESILPGKDDANRSAVLIWESLSVKAEG